MKNVNSKKIRSTLFRKSLFGWIAVGAGIAFLLGLAAIAADEEELIGAGIVALVIFAIIGAIVGNSVSSKFAAKLKKLEQVAAIPFDNDQLQYLDSKKTIALGQDWLMIHQDKKFNLLPKEGIVSVDSHNERKPEMVKLWMHVTGINRESIFGQYEACQPDILDVVAQWLGNTQAVPAGMTVMPGTAAPAGMTVLHDATAPAAGAAALMAETVSSAAAPAASFAAAAQAQAAPASPLASETMASAAVQKPAPAPETPAAPVKEPVRVPAPGECPHCFGPNDPSAEVCQWCGSRIK